MMISRLTNALLRALNECIYRWRYRLYCRRAWAQKMGAMDYPEWRRRAQAELWEQKPGK